MPKNGQADRISRMRTFLDRLTSADPELQAALQAVEIDAARIAEGEQLYDAAQQAIMTQNTMAARLKTARRERVLARWRRTRLYRKQFYRAKEDIADAFVRDLLGLNKKPARQSQKLHLEMRNFYTLALNHPQLHELLASTGLTVEAMQAGLAALDELERLSAQEITTKAASLEATKAQDAALDAMDSWRSTRMVEATYATRHKPQLMNALGKKVRARE